MDMSRHYIATDRYPRPTCTVTGCSAPCTLASKYVTKKGEVRERFRAVCSWHHTHPHTVHPLNSPLPRCQAPGCTAVARTLRPHDDGSPRYGPTCRNHPKTLAPGFTNPHVERMLAELTPAERKAAGVTYDRTKKTFRVAARTRTPKKTAPSTPTTKTKGARRV